MTQKIDTILRTFLAHETNWKMTLLRNWSEIMGNLSSKVQIEKILDDTLVLGVYDSCWLQELYLLSPMLLKKINATLENNVIKQLRFKKIGVTKQRAAIAEKNSSRATRASVPLKESEQKALDGITDPQLRELLTQFLARCYQEKE